MTLYAMPVAGSQPEGIVYAVDGNIYVSAFGIGVVYRVSPAGAFTLVTSLPAGHHIRGLAAGAGPTLHFGDYDGCRIYQYSLIFDALVSDAVPCQKIYDVTIGPDGLVWYAGGTKVGEITISGVVTYDPGDGAIAFGIATAPDGTIWYSGDTGLVPALTKIGQIRTEGVAPDAPVPPTTRTAVYITVRKSDGTVFFTLPVDDKYGMVRIDS